MGQLRRRFQVLSVRGLLAAAALASFGCVQESVAPDDPVRVAQTDAAQAVPFHVRDSTFVHIGIGRVVSPHVAAAAGAHPLRSSARQLVPTSWTSRDSSVATVRDGTLRGRAEGMTWLVWSQLGVMDSVPLVVSAAPVRYLDPRVLTADVGAAPVAMQPPAGDSVQFCAAPPMGSGIEISGGSAVRATQPARVAVRCRMTSGATAALVFVATTVAPPAPNPDPVPPPQPQPPVPGAREVQLQLHRFAGAEQATVTSNAIPLPPGWAWPASIDSISIRVGGAEVPIYAEALFGKHKDGSLRSVLVQAAVTPAMSSVGATLVIGALRSSSRPALASVPEPNQSVMLLPVDPRYLVSTDIVGGTVTREAAAAWGGSYSSYENKFDQFQQYHWTRQGDLWTENFYDRSFAFFAFRARYTPVCQLPTRLPRKEWVWRG